MCGILCYIQGISSTTLSPHSSAAGDPLITLYPVLMLTSWWILYVIHFAISSLCPGYLWACWKVQTVGELHFSPSLSNSSPLRLICTLVSFFSELFTCGSTFPFILSELPSPKRSARGYLSLQKLGCLLPWFSHSAMYLQVRPYIWFFSNLLGWKAGLIILWLQLFPALPPGSGHG